MKFAKHLQNTEVSEWKKAYIDYRGLKKLINAVQISRKGLDVHPPDSGSLSQDPLSTAVPCPSEVDSYADQDSLERSRFELPPLNISAVNLSIEPLREPGIGHRSSVPPQVDPIAQKPSTQTCSFDSSSPGLAASPSKSDSGAQSSTTSLSELPFHKLHSQFTPQELTFFEMLDAQLNKVELFYLDREKEMVARGFLLLNQLEELKEHQKMFLEAHPKKPWAATFVSALSSRIKSQTNPSEQTGGKVINVVFSASKAAGELGSIYSQESSVYSAESEGSIYSQDSEGSIYSQDSEGSIYSQDSNAFTPISLDGKQKGSEESGWTKRGHREKDDRNNKGERSGLTTPDDPSSYIRAKKKLKKAVLEHYRGLETLHNYRVLNITGFRKAVKKFEKKTKIPVQDRYMTEEVGKRAFVSGEIVRKMTQEMEEMYAAAFARGDKKKALKRLRANRSSKSHHFSTFRSGLLIGLAIPALIDGLVKAFQPHTQHAIPSWDILLFLYGVIFIPALYLFLSGINLLVWTKSRINYIFIFNLDVPSRIDYRQYFEIPSLLLSALCFAFWVSFSGISAPIFKPTTLPLLWLAFATLVMVNPMPVMAKSSRYWLIKTILKLCLPGIRPVEFADFWMGDQLCSFIFTLSNVPLLVCVYVNNFDDDWEKCKNSSRMWPIAFVLASIPFIIRLIQCVKRYFDCKLITHLINAGKYGTGIVSYLFYFMWSYQAYRHGTVFALWCAVTACYSTYACSMDFLVDYSLLQPHSKYFFLRTELMYPHHRWVYYLAMLSNVLVRFLWVIYIPERGPTMMVRSFIAGTFEMLRRLQWNVYRLENEHIGNMDQYRVTREMPLPYACDFDIRDDDCDDSTETLVRSG